MENIMYSWLMLLVKIVECYFIVYLCFVIQDLDFGCITPSKWDSDDAVRATPNLAKGDDSSDDEDFVLVSLRLEISIMILLCHKISIRFTIS
jgi:hypothetical protein